MVANRYFNYSLVELGCIGCIFSGARIGDCRAGRRNFDYSGYINPMCRNRLDEKNNPYPKRREKFEKEWDIKYKKRLGCFDCIHANKEYLNTAGACCENPKPLIEINEDYLREFKCISREVTIKLINDERG